MAGNTQLYSYRFDWDDHRKFILADFKKLWPDGPIIELDNAGHFCQEDCPHTLVALIHQFVQMTR